MTDSPFSVPKECVCFMSGELVYYISPSNQSSAAEKQIAPRQALKLPIIGDHLKHDNFLVTSAGGLGLRKGLSVRTGDELAIKLLIKTMSRIRNPAYCTCKQIQA